MISEEYPLPPKQNAASSSSSLPMHQGPDEGTMVSSSGSSPDGTNHPVSATAGSTDPANFIYANLTSSEQPSASAIAMGSIEIQGNPTLDDLVSMGCNFQNLSSDPFASEYASQNQYQY